VKGLSVTFDDKRDMYWVKGLGFDFWLYFVSGGQWLECDSVKREGDDYEMHLRIWSKGCPSPDWIESAVLTELGKFWELPVRRISPR